MSWKGFLVESKLYKKHPDHWKEWNNSSVLDGGWTEADKRIAVLKFWRAFPRAWVRFHWFFVRDWFCLQKRRLIRYFA